ncbi:hypothetical protein SESBI_47023 [Sesbania bispinosa]|nr:hypothetical protein SESBI_47023 [Sesbania bispinosa]
MATSAAQPIKSPEEVHPNKSNAHGPKANSEVVNLGEDHLHGDWLVVSRSKKSIVSKGKGKNQDQSNGTGGSNL